MEPHPVYIWAGSRIVHTGWLLKQHQAKEKRSGLNSNTLVIALLQYYRYFLLIDWDWFIHWINSGCLCCFCRSRITFHLHLRCNFLPRNVCQPGSRSFFLLHEVCERFPSSTFNLPFHLCLMCGNMFVQEQGQVISENTATARPPQRYFRQPLQGIL